MTFHAFPTGGALAKRANLFFLRGRLRFLRRCHRQNILVSSSAAVPCSEDKLGQHAWSLKRSLDREETCVKLHNALPIGQCLRHFMAFSFKASAKLRSFLGWLVG